VVPIIRKEVHWKRKKGDGYIEGKKEENRLCARDFTGNALLLSRIQDDFYAHNLPAADECGVDIKRGSPAKEQNEQYFERTYYQLGLINQAIEQNNLLMQQSNHLNEIGQATIREYEKTLRESLEKNKELEKLKEKMLKELEIFTTKQKDDERRNKAMDKAKNEKEEERNRLDKEAKEQESKRQEREKKGKEQSRGNDFDMGM